jgi:hypothetical protein
MNKIDYRHIAYHVLLALYFIWLLVYTILIVTSLYNTFGAGNYELTRLSLLLIFFNLVMGTALCIVIRLFKKGGWVSATISVSYIIMAAVSLVTVLLVKYSA